MDQGTIVEPDDRRTWTLLRVLLLALGALAGGVLLSLALGGPARADAPSTPPPPAATTSDASLLGQVSGALADVTRTAVAPVDHLVATVTSGPAGGAHPAAPPAAPPATTLPAALDGVLADVPLSSTPLWQDVLGAQPVQSAVTPLAVVLRPLAPGAADLLAPPLAPASPGAGMPSAATAPSLPTVLAASSGAVSGAAATASGGALPAREGSPLHPAPHAPLGTPDDAVAVSPVAGASTPAVLAVFAAMILLLAAANRPRGWTLPSAPAFGADVSPD